MRASLFLILALGATGLTGCGKKAEVADATSAAAPADAPEAAQAPPSGPTPDQAKAILAAMPAPYNTADLTNGKRVFAQCATCHTLEKGAPNMTGPNLYGVFGRKAASLDSFSYSDGLKATGFVWTPELVDRWITDPHKVAADTKMSFVGLKDPKERADVIAYLKVQTSAPTP